MDEKTELEAWKTFLKGRIAQEEGKNETALDLFESALKIDPDNTSFLKARSNAEAQLNMTGEAIVDRIRSEYSELAKKYVGESDKLGPWIEGLKELQKKAETLDQESLLITMCW